MTLNRMLSAFAPEPTISDEALDLILRRMKEHDKRDAKPSEKARKGLVESSSQGLGERVRSAIFKVHP